MNSPDTAAHAGRAKGATIPADLADRRLLRPAEVAEMFRCSRSHVYRLSKAGELPPPIRLSHGVAGWRARDVLALIERRAGAA